MKIRAPDHLDLYRFPIDPWRLVEREYDKSDLGLMETLFATGNGYIGMRGNPEEGRDAYTHGTYVNGFHETWHIHHAEEAFGFAKTGQTIVNVPDAKLMKLYVDDEPLLLVNADLEAYERVLDFREECAPRPRVADTRRQAGARALVAVGQPRPPPPGDADLRGDRARRRRAARHLLAVAQPPGRRRRVPRGGRCPRTRPGPAQDARLRPPGARATAALRPRRRGRPRLSLRQQRHDTGLRISPHHRDRCPAHRRDRGWAGSRQDGDHGAGRTRTDDPRRQARLVPHVDRGAGRGARRSPPPHA